MMSRVTSHELIHTSIDKGDSMSAVLSAVVYLPSVQLDLYLKTLERDARSLASVALSESGYQSKRGHHTLHGEF